MFNFFKKREVIQLNMKKLETFYEEDDFMPQDEIKDEPEEMPKEKQDEIITTAVIYRTSFCDFKIVTRCNR